jgi:hypothetical protein
MNNVWFRFKLRVVDRVQHALDVFGLQIKNFNILDFKDVDGS